MGKEGGGIFNVWEKGGTYRKRGGGERNEEMKKLLACWHGGRWGFTEEREGKGGKY